MDSALSGGFPPGERRPPHSNLNVNSHLPSSGPPKRQVESTVPEEAEVECSGPPEGQVECQA